MATKALTFVLLFFLGILMLAYNVQINNKKTDLMNSDYGKLYLSSKFFVQNKNPYTPVYVTENNKLSIYAGNLNPPFFQVITAPLGYLSFEKSFIIWTLISIFGGLLTVFLLYTIFPSSLNYFLALTLFLFLYFPTFANFIFGQVTLLLLPLTVGAWLAARHNKVWATGVLLGLAASIKVFFGLFFIYFLFRREWRALGWFLLTLIFCFLLSLIPFGIKIYHNYETVLQSIKWYTSSWNVSLYGFSMRLFGGAEKNVPFFSLPALTHKFYLITSAVLLFFLFKFLQPTTKIDYQKKINLDFSLIIIAMLLLSPLAWVYYFPFLIIPIITLMQLAEEGHQPLVLYPLTCLAVILSSIPVTLKPASQIITTIDIFVWSGCYFYALIILLALLFYSGNFLLAGRPKSTFQFPNYLPLALYALMLLPSLYGILYSTEHVVSHGNTDLPKIKIVRFGE